MVTLYEQIEEAEEKLNLNPEGDDNGNTDNDKPDEEAGDESVRRQGGQKQGEHSGKRTISKLGRGGASDGGASGERASRDKSGTSSGDARTSDGQRGTSRRSGKDAQSESEGTQEDAPTSQEDGESDDGRSGQDGRPLDEDDDKPKTNADWARQRRELRELKAKLAQLESTKTASAPAAEIKPAAESPKSPEKITEPDKNVNYQAWLEWKLEQNDLTIKEQNKVAEDYKIWKADQTKQRETQVAINNAVGEFQGIEESYQKKNPDYLNAMEFARNEYARALKLTNPQMTQQQIDSKIDYDILTFASQKSQAGLNPAEELYDMAIERFGYTRAEAKREVEEWTQKPASKSNLKVVSNNKRRSASPLSGGGRGGDIPVTLENAANGMTMGEFSNLTPDQLMQLESEVG